MAHRKPILQQCILPTLRQLLRDLTARQGISTEDIALVSVVGNTAMHHLLLGIDPSPPAPPPPVPPLRVRRSPWECGAVPVPSIMYGLRMEKSTITPSEKSKLPESAARDFWIWWPVCWIWRFWTKAAIWGEAIHHPRHRSDPDPKGHLGGAAYQGRNPDQN